MESLFFEKAIPGTGSPSKAGAALPLTIERTVSAAGEKNPLKKRFKINFRMEGKNFTNNTLELTGGLHFKWEYKTILNNCR
jgi:hypothetical protein